MNPRAAILSVILALAFLTVPFLSAAQQPGKVYRIGYLGSSAPTPTDQTPQQCPIKGGLTWRAFIEGLREHGYLPGENLLIECRWTEARAERTPTLVAELVSLKPDLIVVRELTPGVRAAKQATSTIPIVLVDVNYPVEQGLVANLAHPGGNVTGVSGTAGGKIRGKRLQLLKEAVPRVSRVAVLRYSGGGGSLDLFGDEEAAAQELGLTLQLYGVRAPEGFEGAFAAMTKARGEALFVEDWTFLGVHAQQIVDLATQSRLPAVYPTRYYVQAGGLMSYGTDLPAIHRRAGFYVDKIFKGAKPGDLPVEQPTKFDLLINLKTAKALGLTLPQSLLNRADEVIQ